MPWYKDKIFWYLLGFCAFFKALAVTFIYLYNPLGEHVLIFPDSLSYIYPAQTWLTYGQFWEAVSATPLILRTPGYPVFLAVIQLITGNSTWAVAILQNILSLGLLIPVYLTTREISNLRAARWSAIFCAGSVLYFSLSFAVLTEILCTFLLAWFVFFLVKFLKCYSARWLVASACVLAAAIYVRPAAYYLAPAVFVFIIITCKTYWKQIVLCFFLPLFFLLGSWHLRNYLSTGFPGFSTVNAYNLYFWNEDLVAQKLSLSIPQAHNYLQNALPENFGSYRTTEQVKTYRALATPWLRVGWFYKLLHAPRWAAKTLLGTNFLHTSRLLTGKPANEQEMAFHSLNQTQFLHTRYLQTVGTKIILILSCLQVWGTVLLGIIGSWLLRKQHKMIAYFLAGYCIYFWAIGSVFFGAYARFRAPFEFVLCILAAPAFTAVLHRLQPHR